MNTQYSIQPRSPYLISLLLFTLFACQNDAPSSPPNKENSNPTVNSKTNSSSNILFNEVSPQHSGINFKNNVKESASFNYWNYLHFYNGGGVAIGDINNDALPDIYFVSNAETDKLYLNEGNLKFKDITQSAGLLKNTGWHTSASFMDINADGFLDIYVCKSGLLEKEKRKNLLYINNGNLTFTETATTYGLDDSAYSNEAAFLDYNRDGLLDMYLVNHPIDYQNNQNIRPFEKGNFDKEVRDKLYQQLPSGQFKDVSLSIGIDNLAWGLSVSISDLNNDNWPDIYVANDFLEPDFMYINQNGKFKNKILSTTQHISFNSMGSDINDINNDGLPDILVVDMLPQSNKISKTMMASMRPAFFRGLIASGNHHQYMLNTLQLNQGNGHFSEIGQLAGIAQTDWSWSVLAADFDNDGWKDIFVSNGIKKNVTDNDLKVNIRRSISQGPPIDPLTASQMAPSMKNANVLFRNNGDLTFSQENNQSGLSKKINSNGASYADLDLDGDLDLVINNMDEFASIYENKSTSQNFLRVQLNGSQKNKLGIGSKIKIIYDGKTQTQELYLTKGFYSSVEPIVHFGLGKHSQIDTLEITWASGKIQRKFNISTNQVLQVYEKEAQNLNLSPKKPRVILKKLNQSIFVHQENPFDDFKREILLPHKQSQNGPFISVGDVNGDQLQDFYIGGAYGTPGALFLQNGSNSFKKSQENLWLQSKNYEDVGSTFVDIDNDGDLDLYVVSGGNETNQTQYTQDRFYINDGKGNFTYTTQPLPSINASGSCVITQDFDQDGDQDLFVGGGSKPGQYPLPENSYLLLNEIDKNGKFKDVTSQIAPDLQKIGIVKSAVWTDFNNDKNVDLIVVGEWMPISFFENQNGKFINVTAQYQLENSKGWWNTIQEFDVDGDNDLDYLIGNIGLNNKFKPSVEKPLHIYTHDFDQNNSLDIVLAKHSNLQVVPVRGRECSSEQMPFILDKFPTYSAFGDASVVDIYGNQLQEAYHLEANHFYSIWLERRSNGSYQMRPLPIQAQFSAINAFITADFDDDGQVDILAAGNRYGSEPETVRYDASMGVLLKNNKGALQALSPTQSGFKALKNVKSLAMIQNKENQPINILVGNNNDTLQIFQTSR